MDATDITLIYDNGSVSKKNLAGLKNKSPEFHYICAFSINSCKELLDISVNDYTIVNIYDDKNVLCYRTTRIYGVIKKNVFSSLVKIYIQGNNNGLLNSIKKKQQQLQKLKEQLRNPNSRISKKGSDIDARVRENYKRRFWREDF
jgi:hypothetical protein